MLQTWSLKSAVSWLDGFRCQSHFWAFWAFIYLSWRDIPAAVYFIVSAIGTWFIAPDQRLAPDHESSLELWSSVVPFGTVFGNFILCFSVSMIFRRLLLLRAPSVMEAQDHGLRTAKLTEIKRQKSSRHRSAIKALSDNDIRKGLAKLKPDIYEAAPESLHRHAVDMWHALKNPKAGIIVQTNRQKAELNHLIKSSLGHQALERGKSAHFRVWRSLSLSNARKALTQSYEGATHIRFNRDVRKIGVKRGDTLSIKNIDHEKGLLALRNKHKEVTFKPSIHARGKGASEVYRQSEIELHKGDRVRFTRGGRGRPVNNNDMGEVTKIDDKNIHLSLDRNKTLTIPRTSPVFNHIDHG